MLHSKLYQTGIFGPASGVKPFMKLISASIGVDLQNRLLHEEVISLNIFPNGFSFIGEAALGETEAMPNGALNILKNILYTMSVHC